MICSTAQSSARSQGSRVNDDHFLMYSHPSHSSLPFTWTLVSGPKKTLGVCQTCWHWRVLTVLHLCFPGLSPAGALWGDFDPSRGGEAHYPESQESATAPVWAAGLRVCPPYSRCQPQSHCPALQQLQCSVPEQLGGFGWINVTSNGIKFFFTLEIF